MNRRSLGASIFGLSSAVVVAVACGGKSAPPQQPLSNESGDPSATGGGAAAEPGLPAGVTDGALWTCQISDYDPQPCKFHREGNEWRLTKLLGSQRFDGAVTFGESGFRFVGQFFCPWGACDEAMDLVFSPTDDGYQTDFSGDVLSVRWNEPLASEWGGAGYGNLTGREQ
ncbi:MAG: hypothetical protein K8M05_20100 [Deltaproteobacteria bacterium]|nr:hypothetical protein [Kofleriaceae bacterium]